MVFGEQRDLTDRQMDAIEHISFWMSEAFPEEFSTIKFQIGLDM
jgi:hypothetical protein